MDTAEGTWQDHAEKLKGSIVEEKFADFCIPDEDILSIYPQNIDKIQTLTIFIGRKYLQP